MHYSNWVEGFRTHLGNVKCSPVSLTISQDNKDTSLTNSSSDLIHLWRVFLHRVLEIRVDPWRVVNRGVGPDAPKNE